MKTVILGIFLVLFVHADGNIKYDGVWGDWQQVFQAPEGYFACGAMARVQDVQGKNDDTAMNGL